MYHVCPYLFMHACTCTSIVRAGMSSYKNGEYSLVLTVSHWLCESHWVVEKRDILLCILKRLILNNFEENYLSFGNDNWTY